MGCVCSAGASLNWQGVLWVRRGSLPVLWLFLPQPPTSRTGIRAGSWVNFSVTSGQNLAQQTLKVFLSLTRAVLFGCGSVLK